MKDMILMEIRIHHEKYAAEHEHRREERKLRKAVEREAGELKSLEYLK